jgi:hypothetical protein
MSDVVWATVGDTRIGLTVAEGVPVGPTDVGFDDGTDVAFGDLDFADVAKSVQEVAFALGAVWEKVKPRKASVEFSVSISAKTGKLLGVLVEGGGEGAMKVSLEWGG